MRQFIETANLVSGAALNGGGRTIFSNQLPTGEGWRNLNLRFGYVFTKGTGTPATTDGLLHAIRNVLFKTDRGEQICNLPGKALFQMGIVFDEVVPMDPVTSNITTGTQYVNLTIPFVDKRMGNMEDTILDTSRYNSLTLDINMGTVSDLLTVTGDTCTFTLDVEVQRNRGILPKEAKPKWYRTLDFRQPVDASTTTSIDLERSPDLWYKRIFVYSCTGGTAGLPFFGASSDAVQNVVQLKDQSSFIQKDRIHDMIRTDVNRRYQVQANTIATNAATTTTTNTLKGLEVFDFVTDLSHYSAMYTGDKSILQYTWTNQAGVASGYLVTLATEGIRLLK